MAPPQGHSILVKCVDRLVLKYIKDSISSQPGPSPVCIHSQKKLKQKIAKTIKTQSVPSPQQPPSTSPIQSSHTVKTTLTPPRETVQLGSLGSCYTLETVWIDSHESSVFVLHFYSMLSELV